MASAAFTSGHDMGPVLIVTPWFPNTPTDRTAAYVYESAAALARRGLEVHVLVCRPWVPRRLRMMAPEWMRGDVDTGAFAELESVTCVRYPGLPGGSFRPLANLAMDHRVRSVIKTLVRQTGARIVHVHTEGLAPVVASISANGRCRSVVTVHGLNTDRRFLHSNNQRRRLRRAMNDVDRVLLVGGPLSPFFRELVGRDDHFRVIPNGLNVEAIPRRRESVLRSGAPARLVSVSYLHEGKGIDITLRALALLRAQGVDNWAYTIVGDGYQRSELAGLAEGLGLAQQVTFAGSLPREKVFEMLARSDVFVLPSYREAFGIAWLEGMAAGLVTIAVRDEGPSAFIESGRNGFLVEPRNPEELAILLRGIFESPEQMRIIGAAAKETVRSSFTWDAHADKLLSCYSELLEQDRSPIGSRPRLEAVH